MAELNPPLGTTTPEIFLDNVKRADELVNGPAGTVNDRGGEPLDTWRQIMAVNQAKQDQLDDIITSLDTASFTFSDTTAGLAGTTDGQYFRVPQGEGDAVGFIYYKNSAGAAVVVASLASAEITKLLGK
ncbi:TPA: right-handed parallel beta-helix repeat-containing protein, partial [Klebsiella pneumoniae]